MRATQFEFRFRLWISGVIYLLGFWAPWLRFGKSAGPVSTTWLELSGELSRWMPIEPASVLITAGAIALAAMGTALRVWGTAYRSGSAEESSVAARGSLCRYLCSPLSLGILLFALAVSILMPPSGAVFFLVAGFVQFWRLILREKSSKVGQSEVNLMKRDSARVGEPRWIRAFSGEIFFVTMTVCFAVLAWRYNATLLIQALLICFGFSLVVRAFATIKA